jgi:hypothetical protein
MARRYGTTPDKFLDMPLEKVQFNLLAYYLGLESEIKAKERALSRGKKRS